ncbi:S8 family serine peptidase [bacterium]|nr:S8 family serine peptidase [bacterium]
MALVFAVAGFAASAAPASALGLVAQWPTLDTWEHRTAWPVFAVFDAGVDPATVNGSSLFVSPAGAPGSPIAGTISVETTNVADDTVIFTPDDRLTLGAPYILQITTDIETPGDDPFDGVVPGGGMFVSNVPMDLERPDYDPLNPFGLFVNSNVLPGFDVVDPESTDPDKPWTIPGMGATQAWKLTTGRPDVVIAIIDNGLALYNNREIADRLFLNVGELPMPQDGGTPCGTYDCNGDGRVAASDYANDPRVPAPPPAYPLSPAELLAAFADGVDNDGNGYADDISGWDFFRNTPDAIGIDEWPEGAHGDDRAKDACAMADNDEGDKPGFCPNCTVLPIRVADAILASHNQVGQGVRYASMMGAQVGVAASGTPDYNRDIEDIIAAAHDGGMLLVAAAGDELGFHHSYPAGGEDVLSVKSIFPMPNVELFDFFPINLIAYTETYCTNYNEHVHLAGASGACSSEATGNVGGAAGLILSRAYDLGIDLSPNEVKQILIKSADDIANRCVTLTGGGCQPGFDRHFGYGRPNLARAMEMLGDGLDALIPPEVRITSPRWWALVDAAQSTQVSIEAFIHARGDDFDFVVEAAVGPEPLGAEFVEIASGSGSSPVTGVVATLDLTAFFSDAELRGPTADPDDHTITLRVRATSETGAQGEDRKAIAAYTDDDPASGWLPGTPFDLAASGESSPALYDLDGRDGGLLEIIFGTTNGKIEVFGWDEAAGKYARRPGFPVNIQDDSGPYEFDFALASPAVADLYGDGVPYIVTASGGGRVFAIHPNGNLHTDENGDPDPFLDGFPYVVPKPDSTTPKGFGHGNAFAASPVVADLNGDGVMEIIAANFQAKIFVITVFDAKSGAKGGDHPGFPVAALSTAGTVPANLVCKDDGGDPVEGIQILGTPAVGILDPSSADPALSRFPSIVVPTTEVCYDGARKTGRLYAIRHDGNAGGGSPFHVGWPLALPAPLADALPIPPLTSGITAAPAMMHDGARTVIGTGAFAYLPQLVTVENGVINTQTLPANFSVNISGHGAFDRVTPGGDIHYALPTTSAVKGVDGWLSLLRPLLLAWNLDGPTLEPIFSANLEDINFYVAPIFADVSGDGVREVVAGSSGFMLHAVSPDGTEPAGWPKYTFNWMIASSVAGDVDNDGSLDVFQTTHEGQLFGWRTPGAACLEGELNSGWRRFHHDERNTGVLGTDTAPPGVILDFTRNAAPNGGTRLRFDAPGDDWYCGAAAGYDIRVGDDPDALLTPEGFLAAQVVANDLQPKNAGILEQLDVDSESPDRHYAIRAIDDAGNLGHIAFASPAGAGDDDDDADDDDFNDDDDAADDDAAVGGDDDDDDDGGCCGC